MTTPAPHIWYELQARDMTRARDFYGQVMGWTFRQFEPGSDYTLIEVDGAGVGGMMSLPEGAEQAGMSPGWLGYLGVADVDAQVTRIIAAGGRLCMPATVMPLWPSIPASSAGRNPGSSTWAPAVATTSSVTARQRKAAG